MSTQSYFPAEALPSAKGIFRHYLLLVSQLNRGQPGVWAHVAESRTFSSKSTDEFERHLDTSVL